MQRIQSVDILRGLTILAMILVNNPGDWGHVYPPLLHAEWHGLTPTDLIFPFFIFIVGVSITLAYQHKKASRTIYKKIFIRSAKLIALGLFLNWFIPYFPFFESYETVRLPGVLQRIGIVFCITSFLYLNCTTKTLLHISFWGLVGYFIVLNYVPLPNGEVPSLARVPNNWANYIDVQLLDNHLWKPDYDPEGILSTIPAIISCIIGVLIGKVLLLKNTNVKLKYLFGSGSFALLIGYIWNVFFPINKALWSSSFVLVTAGWAILFLLIFYYVADVQQKTFGKICIYVGTNAITIYFLSSLVAKTFYLVNLNEQQNIHSFLYEHLYTSVITNNKLASLLYAFTVMLSYILLGFILFKRRIFIKV
ncbi:Heparan-alpha-glucosaminide N-acetyltransferase [Tenacibaculum sp. 190130A14a]|uniref:Heparan-alpha-glucosaminide N-acetyltransferase n=1 Tax=Tenacibaculum polynesiense TaxID=3137857 RepID=A0ABM9P8U5_9FLAO